MSGKSSRPFTMVRRSLWGSERFAALPDDDTRYYYLYLLTCPHQTSSGCFILKEAYALADLAMTGATWAPAKYRKVKAAAIASGLILADDTTGEILIARWWKDNSPNNESWFAGARKQCDAIKSTELREAAQEALEACWEEFAKAKSLLRPGTESGASGHPGVGAGVDPRLAALNRRLDAR